MPKITDPYYADETAKPRPLDLAQLNRLDDEADSLAKLLRNPALLVSFSRIIDACNELRYACLNTHETPGSATTQLIDAEAPGGPTVAECIAQLDTWSGRLEAAIDRQALEQLGRHPNDEPFVVGAPVAGAAS